MAYLKIFPRKYKQAKTEQQTGIAVSSGIISGILDAARRKRRNTVIAREQDQKRRISKAKSFKRGQKVRIKDTKLVGKVVKIDSTGSVFVRIGKKAIRFNVTVVESVKRAR